MIDFFDHIRDHGRLKLTLHEYFEEQIENGAIARGGGVDGGNAIANGGGDYFRAYGYDCWEGPQGRFWQDEDETWRSYEDMGPVYFRYAGYRWWTPDHRSFYWQDEAEEWHMARGDWTKTW